MEYFYPSDVIVTTDENGKRTARLGYDVRLFGERGMLFISHLPVKLCHQKLNIIIDALHLLWLDGRERFRHEQSEKFLARYPNIQRDRKSWDDFITAGNEPSITAWRSYVMQQKGTDE